MKTRLLAMALVLFAAACSKHTKTAPAEAKVDTTPVAKYGSTVVTAGELDESIKSDLARMDQAYQEQRAQLRHDALEAMIAQKLLDARAKAQNTTSQELLKKDVFDKISEPTDAEVAAVYDQAKKSGQKLPPLEKIRPDVVVFLKKQKMQPAMAAYAEGLRKEAGVQILLAEYEPPKVEVEAKGPTKGPQNAKVTIVEFSDFECPYCSRAEETVKQVLSTYGDKVKLVYRDFPLPFHSLAPKAAEASHCAEDQNKYWEMHDKLFATHKLEIADLKQQAKDLGLDTAKFDQCLDSGAKASVVQANQKAGQAVGVKGTPAFFINGHMLSGAQPFTEFQKFIDRELSRS